MNQVQSKIDFQAILQKKTGKVKKYTKEDLFAATQIVYANHWNYQQIRQNAVKYLKRFHSKGTIKDFPIEKGAEIVFVGQTTHLKFREVRERLLPLGISCKVFVKETTTHVVLGAGAKKDKGFLKHSVTIINTKELNVALEELEEPYLLEENADSQQNVNHLGELLLSGQDENIALALEIFKGGGFPKELLHELLIAYKMTNTSKLRNRARSLLYLHISEASRQALKYLQSLSGRIGERNLANGIRRMTKNTPEFSGEKIAVLMYMKHRKGLTYLLEYLPQKKRLEWLKSHVKDGILDLSKSHLYKCFKVISDLKQVEKLDLSGNNLRALPASIFLKMKHVKVLKLSNNNFREIPMVLYKMPQLEELHMHFRPWIWTNYSVQSGIVELQQALPNCRIITNE